MDYLDEKYNETFDVMYDSLIEQKKKGLIDLEELRALLRDQYIFHDHDWLGRSEAKNVTNNATIAAIETVIYEWKEELEKR